MAMRGSSLPILLLILVVLGSFLGYTLFTQKIPCVTPISYALTAYDERFGLTRGEIESAIREAAAVWNVALEREVFVEKDDAELPIIFLYQELQKTIDSIESINDNIDAAKAEQTQVANLHGTLKKEYDQAVREGRATQKMVDELNRLRARYYELRDVIQAQIARGRALPLGEKEAGLYESDQTGARIYIYGFGNKDELLSTLMHEFGHALGLEHVSEKNAVMYPSDTNTSTALHQADRAELARACSEQKTLFSDILLLYWGIV
jgi:predicted Zn-dependent protease